MVTRLDLPVSVESFFDHHQRRFEPRRLFWSGKSFTLTKIGLHHTYRQGRTLYHVFSVATERAFFRLELNSESLNWSLREVSDGLPD
jgi:hypothetical protein